MLDIFNGKLKSKTIYLKKDETLFLQGIVVESIFVVKKGRVKLIRDTEDGVAILIHTAYTNEFFAEASLFSDKYHCHCIADCACEITVYAKTEILQYIQKNSQMMMNFLKMLTSQVRDLRFINELKSIKSAENRVLNYLQHSANSKNEVKFTSSLKDISQKIGLAHETFYRVLASLIADNKITRKNNIIKII